MSTKLKNKIIKYSLLLAGFCFIIPALNLFMQSVSLLSGWQVSGMLCWISVGAGFIFLYFIFPYRFVIKEYLISIIIFLIFIAVSLSVSLYYYDTSRDGQAYHQEAIIQLREGWNPTREELSKEVMLAFFLDHYPKASWINAAAVYDLTGEIESSKIFNYLYISGTFLLVLYLLAKLKLSLMWAFISATLATLNTVAIVQLHSNMVDHINAHIMTSLLACFILLVLLPEKQWYWYVLILSLLIIFDTKFTSIVNACLFLMFFNAFIYFVKRTLIKRTLALSLISMCLYLVTSFSPYLTNILDSKHPLYPAMGSDKINVIGGQVPENFINANQLFTFTNSLFSKSGDGTNASELKFPWQLSWEEFSKHATKTGARKAGFGGTFALYFILAFLIFTIACSTHLNKGMRISGFITLALLCTVLISPVNWWARMVPQLWLVPIIWLAATILFSDNQNFRISAKILILSALHIQGFYLGSYFWYENTKTRQIDHQIKTLLTSESPILVDFGPCPSVRKRWEECRLKYQNIKLDENNPDVKRLEHSMGLYLIQHEEN